MLRSQRREPTCELACPAVATKLARSEPAVWTWVVDEREEIVIESHDAWKTKEFVIEFHDAGKIIARLLSARAGALRPDAAVIALLAHAGRTVLVLPRRALLADATFSLTLFRHVGQLFTRIVRSGERLALEENVKRVVELLLATVGHSQRSGVVQVGEMLTEQRSAFAMLGPWDHAAAGEPYRSAALDLAPHPGKRPPRSPRARRPGYGVRPRPPCSA